MSETTDRPGTTAATEPEGTKWLSGIASLIGLWILISPFALVSTEAAVWNNVVVGAAIFLIAGFNYYRIVNGLSTNIGAMSLVALLGLWTLIAPFVLAVGSEALLWSNVVAGLLGLLVAGYVAYTGRKVRTEAPAATD